MTTAPELSGTETFPKLLLEHARVRGDRTSIREKDLGIWQSWTWSEAVSGASGRLECERHGERVEMAFAHGRPLWGTTSGRAVRVGDVLLHGGWIESADLDATLEQQHVTPGRRVGELLLERGVPPSAIAAAVAEVFRRLVCLLSLWPDGRFQFVPGVPDGADEGEAELDLELDRLLIEGLHQADLAQGTA